MNERQARLMDAPSWETLLCPFCGKRFQSRHHIVYRSQGGETGPTITVCGTDNVSGCHGLIHQGFLHLDYRDGHWVFIKTKAACNDEKADQLRQWTRLANWDEILGIF